MPDIEVVSSPRPEDGHEPPLPTYHELLNTLCDEFHVPGSPTFSEAVRYIKDHSYPPMIQRFKNWCILEGHGSSDIVLKILETYTVTPEGRQRIAESYVAPAQQRLHRALREPSEARQLALIIETLISIFPEGERFYPPLITLREVLIDLYGLLSPNYERNPDQDYIGEPEYEEDPLPASARGRVSESVTPEEPPYEGPRPTLFEHLFREED
jgi:hypothetical protein